MKKLFVSLSLGIALLGGSALGLSADDKVVRRAKDLKAIESLLPQKAWAFASSIEGYKFSRALELIDDDTHETKYKAYLRANKGVRGGVVLEVEFDKDGQWREVDAEGFSTIPASVLRQLPGIPAGVADYVAKRNRRVESVERTRSGYSVDIYAGGDYEFDTQGNFLRVDD